MPVNSADPFGGVIITDWHSSAEAPNERFKLNIYILGRALRADGIRVAVFRIMGVHPNSSIRCVAPRLRKRYRQARALLTRAHT